MVAGHLQQKKGYWYVVLNLYDEQGKRKTKWIATHLPVQGSKHWAEELLLQIRQQYADSRTCSGLLFADYMLQWLEKMKPKVSPTTYHSYKYNIERGICPYFRERGITLAKLRALDLEEYYAYLQRQGLSANTAIHHHANIHKRGAAGFGGSKCRRACGAAVQGRIYPSLLLRGGGQRVTRKAARPLAVAAGGTLPLLRPAPERGAGLIVEKRGFCQ